MGCSVPRACQALAKALPSSFPYVMDGTSQCTASGIGALGGVKQKRRACRETRHKARAEEGAQGGHMCI